MKSIQVVLLTAKDAAAVLKLSLSWLAKARMRGDGPPYAKIGRSIRYRKHALVRGLKSRARLSMSESEQMAKNPLRLSYPGRNVAQTHFKGRTAKFIARQNVNENSQKVIRRSHQGCPREGSATQPYHQRFGVVAWDRWPQCLGQAREGPARGALLRSGWRGQRERS